MQTTIGVVSDTHGLLRPEAVAALCGCDLILHAGDIGDVSVIVGLQAIAPVVAVRGNVDCGAWVRDFPATAVASVGERHFYVLHNLDELDIDPRAAGIAAVISGHTHRPLSAARDGVLYLNPGSAGPRRFTLPVAVAKIVATPQGLHCETIELDIA